jgi:hypothetical protein
MATARPPSTPNPAPVNPQVVTFLPRKDLLELRGRRNYTRYMLINKKFVAVNGPEHLRWQRESEADSQHDEEWNRRHGSIPGGAVVVQWRHETDATRQELRPAHEERGQGDGC